MVSAIDQQALVSSFLEVAQGQTAATARQFLQVRLTSLSLFFFFFASSLLQTIFIVAESLIH